MAPTFLGAPTLNTLLRAWQEPFAESGATGLVAMMQVGCGNDDRSGNFSSDPKPFSGAVYGNHFERYSEFSKEGIPDPQKWPKEFRFSGIYFNKNAQNDGFHQVIFQR